MDTYYEDDLFLLLISRFGLREFFPGFSTVKLHFYLPISYSLLFRRKLSHAGHTSDVGNYIPSFQGWTLT